MAFALSFYTDMFSDMCLFFVRVWSPYWFSHFYCSFPLFRLYWFVLWKGFDTSCGDFSVFLYATCANYVYNVLIPGAVVVEIVRQLNLQLPMQPVPVTTNVVSSNTAQCEVYSIQYSVIKVVNDLRQVDVFHSLLPFHTPLKLTATIYICN